MLRSSLNSLFSCPNVARIVPTATALHTKPPYLLFAALFHVPQGVSGDNGQVGNKSWMTMVSTRRCRVLGGYGLNQAHLAKPIIDVCVSYGVEFH